MKRYQVFCLIALLLTAFFIRFYRVEQIPNGLYYDEIDAGYQARSLIETGKDYRGYLSPFYVRSFLDPRPPIPVYFTAISTQLFSTPELQVRMSSVILGTLNVLLLFWLIFQWFGKFKVAFIVSFVFATNPWMIQFSRFNHEANSVLFFILLGLNFFYKALISKRTKFLFLSAIFLSLGIYTYRTMSMFVPMIFVTLFVIYKKEILKFGVKNILLVVLVTAAITLPFLYATTFGAADKPRIAQISIFSDPTIPIWVQRNRELDSNDFADNTPGKQANKESYFFHNKLISFASSFTNNYLHTFSMDFLFIKGDQNHRHSIHNQGMLFYIDLLAIGFGLYFIFSNLKDKKLKLLLSLLFLSPIPASITGDGAGHGARLITFSVFILIVAGLGWLMIINKLQKLKLSKIYLTVMCFFLESIFCLLFT